MAFLRLLVMLLVALTVVYFGVFYFLKENHREKLDKAYSPEATDLQKSAFVDAGVEAYAAKMKKVLALIVYGVPLSVFALVILTSNTS